MSKTAEIILKYKLQRGNGYFAIHMPMDAEIMSIQMQNGAIYAWAWCPAHSVAELVPFEMYVTGTGQPFDFGDGGGCYVGTVQDDSGFVWHYFITKYPGQTT